MNVFSHVDVFIGIDKSRLCLLYGHPNTHSNIRSDLSGNRIAGPAMSFTVRRCLLHFLFGLGEYSEAFLQRCLRIFSNSEKIPPTGGPPTVSPSCRPFTLSRVIAQTIKQQQKLLLHKEGNVYTNLQVHRVNPNGTLNKLIHNCTFLLFTRFRDVPIILVREKVSESGK